VDIIITIRHWVAGTVICKVQVVSAEVKVLKSVD